MMGDEHNTKQETLVTTTNSRANNSVHAYSDNLRRINCKKSVLKISFTLLDTVNGLGVIKLFNYHREELTLSNGE